MSVSLKPPPPPPELDVVEFKVPGLPAPQGSKTLGHTSDGTPFLRESSSAVAPWRQAVAMCAGSAWKQRPPMTGPVLVRLTFWMPRPGDARVCTVWNPHRPDVDKLTRSTLDALCAPVTGKEAKRTAMAYPILSDDGQVVVALVEKRAIPKGGQTGAEIQVVSLAGVEAAGYEVRLSWGLGRRLDARR